MAKNQPRGCTEVVTTPKMANTELSAEEILKLLQGRESVDTYDLSQEFNKDHQQIIGAIKSLSSLGDVIVTEQRQFEQWVVTDEGSEVIKGGSHEARVYYAVDPRNGSVQADIMKSVPNAKIGFSKAMSSGWLSIDKKAEGGPRLRRKVEKIEDTVQTLLKKIGKEEVASDQLKEFKKRKLINNDVIKCMIVRKGTDFRTQVAKQDVNLTPEMIQSGSWKDKSFKAYNFDALGVPPSTGHLHPLLKVRTEIRKIFLEMGFTEMPTNNFIESSFWNFDALFQPQQHPARDAHDTFFIKGVLQSQDYTVLSMKSLEELCLTHVAMTLEQYSTDTLSLLPKGFRLQLLHKIPIIDICRLEDTKFFSGINMQAIWMELHREYLRASLYDLSLDWRGSFFRRLFFAIVRGERLYGHFYVGRMKNRTQMFGRQMNEGRPVSKHEVDFVNFLVAVKREIPVKFSKVNIVTSFKGPMSPGKAYNGLCRAKQLVPPRYAKFFSEGSRYLPDSTALELITEKCHYRPKEFTIDVVSSTLAFNLTPKKSGVNCLRNCLKNVESLNIQGYVEQSQRATVIRGAKYGECKDVARCAVDLILLAPNPKFTSLTIRLSAEDVVDTVTPALTAYGGLKELTLQAYGDVSPDFQKLSSITEHQPLLHTVSILVGIGMVRRSQSNIVSCAPKLSEKHFISWLQTCFKKPLLQDLKLSLEPAYLKFLIQVLTDFLSTPCSHEQTLTIQCDLEEFPPSLPPRPPRVVKSGPPLPPNHPTLTPPPPKPIHSSEPSNVPTTIHQFDDACSMKYKCLTFHSCRIGPSFAKAFLELAPLKLKNMSILKGSTVNIYYTEFLSQLAQQPLIEMESLEVEPDKNDISNFDSILQKKLLKFVTVTCSDSCFTMFSDIALYRGFEIQTMVKTPKHKVMFTLSRN